MEAILRQGGVKVHLRCSGDQLGACLLALHLRALNDQR
jgi:hypothetical protein